MYVQIMRVNLKRFQSGGNMLRKFLIAAVPCVFLVANAASSGAPITLEGMGIIKQWTDLESTAGDMPAFIWGTSDTDGADRIGLHVEFEDGTMGSITYSGVSGAWNTSNTGIFDGGGHSPDTATGFFTAAEGLHFLYNSDGSLGFPEQLPLAWEGLVMPFSNNFDLDYDESNGSNFRASVGGWQSAVFTTYSSTAAAVPEPTSLMLLGMGVAGLGGYRMRRKRQQAL